MNWPYRAISFGIISLEMYLTLFDAKYVSDVVQGRCVGVDIAGSPEVRVNVEAGLPFQDKTFDTVLAFDILEYLDYIYFSFAALCRVRRSYVIVGLHNMRDGFF
jgi:hypothetical protein